MIKIYDDNRNLLISTDEYSNFSVNKEINQPDQFSIDTTEEIGDFIKLEGYIETKEGIFVIKEKSFANYYRIMGAQDLEDLDDFIEHKRFERATLKGMIQGLVAPYGWTVVGDSPDKKTISIDNKSVIDGVFDCINLFRYEIKFDNINKVIYIAKELGEDKGTYFHSDLNLKKTTISSDSYDFATRIIPVGNDGLTIESVNNGKKYLENYKYSNKIKTVYWKDERYHIPENLKATAEEMLENLARPLSSLDCEIVNLVNNSKYSFLDFDVGDKVIIVDNNLKIKEKYRITSYLKYPNEPHRGVVTFENKPRDIIDRFTDIDYRFDNYDSRFDDYDFKFDDYDMRFDDYDFKFDDYDMRFDDFDMKLDDFNLKIDGFNDRLGSFEDRFGIIEGKLEDSESKINEIEDRLELIESIVDLGSCVILNDSNTEIVAGGIPKYIGDDKCVIIPRKIAGLTLIILHATLEDANVEKVILNHSNIIDMYATFRNLESYNLDLQNFNTSNVTDMGHMFSGSNVTYLDLSNFDTSKVTDMSYMFSGAKAENIILNSFDTSNVVNMESMFSGSNVNYLDLSNFDTSKVVNMSGMFSYSKSTSINLSSFNTSNVTDMGSMFSGSNVTYLDLSNFDTSKVTNMHSMFWGSKATNINLSSFDTSNVVNMINMFRDSEALNLDLSSFDTSKVTTMSHMFWGSKATNINLSSFDTSNVTNMERMFLNSAVESLDVSNFDTSKVVNMNSMFSNLKVKSLNLSNFDTSKVVNMNSMFSNLKVKSLNLSNFDTSNAEIMTNMFNGCYDLEHLDLSGNFRIDGANASFIFPIKRKNDVDVTHLTVYCNSDNYSELRNKYKEDYVGSGDMSDHNISFVIKPTDGDNGN